MQLKRLSGMLRDRRGVTALEYALITALVAIVVAGALTLTGTNITKVFSTISNTI